MDCRTAKEKINQYIDGALSSAQTEELLSHAAACPDCRDELDNALRLKKALAALGDLEPPKGLAREALRKAKSRRPVPFAYISVAAAAVIALIVVLTSGVLPNTNGGSSRSADENFMMAAPAEGAQQEEMNSAGMAPAPMEAPAADEYAAAEAPAATEAPAQAPEEEPEMQFSVMVTEDAGDAQAQAVPKHAADSERRIPACIVYVPDELEPDIREALDDMIIEYGFEYTYDEDTDSMIFVISEDIAERLLELTADLQMDGSLIEGETIEFMFE